MAETNKISSLLLDKIQNLVNQLFPQISSIFTQIGIEDVNQNLPTPEDNISKDKLNYILNTRNNIVDETNKTSKSVDILTKPLTPLNNFINTTSKSLQTLSTTRKTINASIALIPPPASPPGSAISALKIGRAHV